MSATDLSDTNNGNSSSNGWGTWAKYIVSETRRFGQEIINLQNDIKEHAREMGSIQNELTKLSAGDQSNVIIREIKDLEDKLKVLEKEMDEKISKFEKETNKKVQKLDQDIRDLQAFKIKAITTVSIVNVLMGVGVVILAIFL